MSRQPPRLDPLDVPLVRFSDSDAVSMRELFEGTIIFGQTGSGKTSGPGEALRTSLLRTGAGFCAFMAKPGDVEDWILAAKREGREADVRVFGPDSPYRLNALDYLYRAPGCRGSGSQTDNALAALCALMVASESGDRPQGGDVFWRDSAKILLGAAVDLLGLSREEVSFTAIQELMTSAPESPEQVRSPEWQSSSRLNKLIDQSTSRTDLTADQKIDLAASVEYWLSDLPRTDPRTRSGICSQVLSMTYPFRRGLLASLFGPGGNQLSPEDAFAGRIVLISLDYIQHQEQGRLGMILWSILFMRSAERRNRQQFPKPVVLWADEAQQLLSRQCAIFASTARAAGCATVYLTQSRDTLRARLGGSGADSEVDALLGNLALKIFTCNDHAATNDYAAKLVGERWETRSNVSAGLGGDGGVSASTTDQRRFVVEPHHFMQLRKGGRTNNGIVESIVFRAGRPWIASGSNHLKVLFRQEGFKPSAEGK
ncbi:MAG TPA: TraM recognition domain-containing protein [Gemmataceae bacterium]|jgi:type IV secretory pathway TraG/TraD family ATPase VirD4|nr:TraM recognition domain-containing protein [Gemmataceae bacterium]